MEVGILMSAGNRAKVKLLLLHCGAFHKFYVQIFNTHLIRLRVIEGPNMHDQIVF